MAKKQDFSLFSGDDKQLDIVIIDGRTGDPYNLSGVIDVIWALGSVPDVDSYCWYIRDFLRGRRVDRHNVAPSIRFSKSYADGQVEIIDAVNGRVKVTIDRSELEPLAGDYYHEACVISADNKKTTMLYGKVSVRANMIVKE
jgi:hypothetical protein